MTVQLRPAARAIVFHNGHMLIMKRTKQGKRYMVTPGGRIEDSETPEEAVIREVAEETTIVISDPRLVFIENPNDQKWGKQYIYVCDYVSGEPVLPKESEEYFYSLQGGGTYEPLWVPCDQLDDEEFPFKSPRLGKEIRAAIAHGFPDEPRSWKL